MKVRNPQKRTRLRRERRHRRIRERVQGSASRPRLAVYRSLREVSAQMIDDASGRTLLSAREADLGSGAIPPFEDRGGKVARAHALGVLLAKKAAEKGIASVVFDRGGFAYHGRIRAFAEGARAGGLKF